VKNAIISKQKSSSKCEQYDFGSREYSVRRCLARTVNKRENNNAIMKWCRCFMEHACTPVRSHLRHVQYGF